MVGVACRSVSMYLLMEHKLTDQQLARTLSRSAAAVVAELEMRNARHVTRAEIATILGVPPTAKRLDNTVADLLSRGWLRPLNVRGAYEFLPASGGPWESGDPWIEFRAAVATSPLLAPQVALGSAAFLRGLADRHPARDIIAVSATPSLPPGLRKTYQVIRATPSRLFGATPLDQLPVATPARLVLETAMWWHHAGDVWSPDHWIRSALQNADIEELREGAKRLGGAVTARAGHFARCLEVPGAERALADLPRPQPVFLGPRPPSLSGVPYDSVWGVYDTLHR